MKKLNWNVFKNNFFHILFYELFSRHSYDDKLLSLVFIRAKINDYERLLYWAYFQSLLSL